MFKLLKKDSQTKARLGTLKTFHGELQTPFFMPVGTNAVVKTLSTEDLLEMDSPIVLSNTYHTYLRPGLEVLALAGGLHGFMQWDRPMLTDSGGYQVFSMGEKRSGFSPSRRVGGEEEGVRESDGATPSPSSPTLHPVLRVPG